MCGSGSAAARRSCAPPEGQQLVDEPGQRHRTLGTRLHVLHLRFTASQFVRTEDHSMKNAEPLRLLQLRGALQLPRELTLAVPDLDDDPHRLEILPCLPEVGRTVLTEEVAEGGCAVEHPSTLGILAIEDPERVTLHPLAALVAEAVGVRAKIADELRPIARPTRWILVAERVDLDRKSTRLNSSHQIISYAVFCLKKKKNTRVSFDRRSISHHCDTPDRLDTLAVRTER